MLMRTISEQLPYSATKAIFSLGIDGPASIGSLGLADCVQDD